MFGPEREIALAEHRAAARISSASCRCASSSKARAATTAARTRRSSNRRCPTTFRPRAGVSIPRSQDGAADVELADPALRIFAGSGGTSPQSSADALRVSFDSRATRAVGGFFRAASFDPFEMRLVPTSRVQLTLDDGSVETIDAPVADGFRGFISDLPIRTLDIRTLDLDDEGNLPWALLDELFVGTPRG